MLFCLLAAHAQFVICGSCTVRVSCTVSSSWSMVRGSWFSRGSGFVVSCTVRGLWFVARVRVLYVWQLKKSFQEFLFFCQLFAPTLLRVTLLARLNTICFSHQGVEYARTIYAYECVHTSYEFTRGNSCAQM